MKELGRESMPWKWHLATGPRSEFEAKLQITAKPIRCLIRRLANSWVSRASGTAGGTHPVPANQKQKARLESCWQAEIL